MHLDNFVKSELIFISEPLDSKEHAIHFLVNKVFQYYPDLNPEEIVQKIIEREKLTSSTFKNGIAIPHIRIDTFNDIVISVLIPAEPLEDEKHDIRLMFLILSDPSKATIYLNIISYISKICHNEENVQFLIAAQSSENFLSRLQTFDISIKKNQYIKDIMLSPPLYLFPDSTVKDALEFMSKHQVYYIPVCDTSKNLQGEVTFHDLVLKASHHPHQHIKKLKTLFAHEEPFEERFKNELKTPLKTFMQKPLLTLTPGMPIPEAVFHYVKNKHRTTLPVVEGNILVGSVSFLDIINKYLK